MQYSPHPSNMLSFVSLLLPSRGLDREIWIRVMRCSLPNKARVYLEIKLWKCERFKQIFGMLRNNDQADALIYMLFIVPVYH